MDRVRVLLGAPRHRCACLTPRRAAVLCALLPLWLALLPLVALWALLVWCGALKLPTHTEGTRAPLRDETAFPDQAWEGFPHSLDCGIYWFSARNGGARHGAGDGAAGAAAAAAAPGGRARFDARRPTLLYVHGLAPTTVGRGFRETFNWGQQPGQLLPPEFDLNAAEAWVAAGWNVGVFYWSQLSDEVDVQHAEAKIWTPDGPRGMRWLRKSPVDGLLEYQDDTQRTRRQQQQQQQQQQPPQQQEKEEEGAGAAPAEGSVAGTAVVACVSAMLAAELRKVFGSSSSSGRGGGGGSDGPEQAAAAAAAAASAAGSPPSPPSPPPSLPTYRLVGHSLGAQLAVAGAHRLLREVDGSGGGGGGGCPLPSRIVLVDPYVSPGAKRYHGGRSGGDVLCEQIGALRSHRRCAGGRGTAFEHVQTSKMDALPSALGVVDLGAGLRAGGGLAAFVELSAPSIPWWDLRGGHIAGPALYLLSFEMGAAGARQQQRRRRKEEEGGWEWEWAGFAGLASASDETIRRLSELPYGFRQRAKDFVRVPQRIVGGDDPRPEPPCATAAPEGGGAAGHVAVEVGEVEVGEA